MASVPRTSDAATSTSTHTGNEMLSLPVTESRSLEEVPSTLKEERHPAVRREQHRTKLAGLYHAAYCTHSGHSACPAHCSAYKRLYLHMVSCRQVGGKCVVPGCAKARLIWTHFATCTNVNCDICSVIPSQHRNGNSKAVTPSPSGKALLPRSPKASGMSQPSASRWPGRPPLSPKPRYQHHHDLPALSPPRSPTHFNKQFY